MDLHHHHQVEVENKNRKILNFVAQGEAMWGMTIIMMLLVIVAIFFCILPVMRLIKKRMNYWDQIENDPRWNIDHFQFSPSHAATQTCTHACSSIEFHMFWLHMFRQIKDEWKAPDAE